MLNRSVLLFFAVLLFCGHSLIDAQNQSKDYPKRLKRSESFFGIHFDFHAQGDYDEIGKHVTREMVEYIIDTVQPDYVQCDSKGHAGFSSYPTKVGIPAPGFVTDPLKIWRDVTAKRGIALYVHYSGAYDDEAVKRYPEWAVVDAAGNPDKRIPSVYGPYADELMIPQLKELSDDYGVDGAWIDGDWAATRDYSEKALAAFRKKTGIQEVPRKPEDPYWREFTEFSRESMVKFINHYVEEIHKHNPGFQITSNWVYGYKMPGLDCPDLDYLSADYNCNDSVNDARLASRCYVHAGIPWDIMSWSFVLKGENLFSDAPINIKTPAMLKQEAAVAISLGGGFEAYFRQKKDGSISTWHMELMRETAEFCRKRQKFCYKAKPVPQIGLIFSGESFYRNINGIFSSWGTPERKPFRGVLNCLLDSQNVVDVVVADRMTEHLSSYPLLVYPEWDYINQAFKKELLEYVAIGGNLLVIGPQAAAHFEDELGITLIGKPEVKANGLEYNGWMSSLKTLSQEVEYADGVKPFGRLYGVHDITGPYETAATITKYGKGTIASTCLNLGERYVYATSTVARDFLDGLVRELFPDPVVEVTGSHFVDVTVNRIDGALTVNLVNTGGSHNNERVVTYDEIPPTGPLNVTIHVSRKPRSVVLEPSGKTLSYTYTDGVISLTLPALEIHDIIVIE